jgi:hypothetical protein
MDRVMQPRCRHGFKAAATRNLARIESDAAESGTGSATHQRRCHVLQKRTPFAVGQFDRLLASLRGIGVVDAAATRGRATRQPARCLSRVVQRDAELGTLTGAAP